MKGLQYRFSLPLYGLAKIYHQIFGKRRLWLPCLALQHNLPMPQPIGPDWVILRTLLCGICGSDIQMLLGQESFSMEPYASFPCIPGHEAVAEIVDVGDAVRDLAVGDRVVVNPVTGCQIRGIAPTCSSCQAGQDNLCKNFARSTPLAAGMSIGYHAALGGGWAEYFQAHRRQIHRVRDGLCSERAVLTDPFACALYAVARQHQKNPHTRQCLVVGAGNIGLLTVAAIRALKLPWKIYVVYRYEAQGADARAFGADVIVKDGTTLLRRITELTSGQLLLTSLGPGVTENTQIDAVFDTIGSGVTVDTALRLLEPRGFLWLLATTSKIANVDWARVWFREITVTGTCMSGMVVDPRNGGETTSYDLALALLADLPIEKLLTDTFAVEDYRMALTKAANKCDGRIGKVALRFQA